MRIMAISDLHGRLMGLDPQGADVVVIAGDIAPLRRRGLEHVINQKNWINNTFKEWTASYPDIRFVVVPGNHDYFPVAHTFFPDVENDWGYEFSPNVNFLIDSGVEIGGVTFYGSPWIPIISHLWAFEAEQDELKNRFSKIPAGLDVLVTHAPPYIPKCDVDRSLQTNSRHFGSPELTEAIAEKQPRFVFCGHIHSGQHGGVDFGSSKIYNVARVDECYDVAYEPTWIEI